MSPDSSDGGEERDEWKFGPQDFGPPDMGDMDEEELEQMMRQRREMMTQSRPTGHVVLTFVLAILMLSVITVGPVLAVWWLFSFEATLVAIGVMFLWLRFTLEGAFGE